jgi:cytochrome c oxidase subunit 4
MSDTKPNNSHSVTPYLAVFGALLVLTGLTFYLSTLHLPHGKAIVLAGIIALTKCSLIAAFFMHLKFDSKSLTAALVTALLLVAMLVFTLIPDIGIVHK